MAYRRMGYSQNLSLEHAQNIRRDRQLNSLIKQFGMVLDVLEKRVKETKKKRARKKFTESKPCQIVDPISSHTVMEIESASHSFEELEREVEIQEEPIYDEDPNEGEGIEGFNVSLVFNIDDESLEFTTDETQQEDGVSQPCVYDDDCGEVNEANIDDFLLLRTTNHSLSVVSDEPQQANEFQSFVCNGAFADEVQRELHSSKVLTDEVLQELHSSEVLTDEVQQELHSSEVLTDEVQQVHSSLVLTEEAQQEVYSTGAPTEVSINQVQKEVSVCLTKNSMPAQSLSVPIRRLKEGIGVITILASFPIRLIIIMWVLVMFLSLYHCHSLLDRSLISSHFESCDDYLNTCSVFVRKKQVTLDPLVSHDVIKDEVISLFNYADIFKYDKTIVWAELSSLVTLTDELLEVESDMINLQKGRMKSRVRIENELFINLVGDRKGLEGDAYMFIHFGGRKYAKKFYSVKCLWPDPLVDLKTNQQPLLCNLRADWKIQCKMKTKSCVLFKTGFRSDVQQVIIENGAECEILCKMKWNQIVTSFEECFGFPRQVFVTLGSQGLISTLEVENLIAMFSERCLSFPIPIYIILEKQELYEKWGRCNLVLHTGGAEIKFLPFVSTSMVESNTRLPNFRSLEGLKKLHGLFSIVDFKLNGNLIVMCFEWYLGYSVPIFISLEKEKMYALLEKCNLLSEAMLVGDSQVKNLIVAGFSKLHQFVFLLTLNSQIHLSILAKCVLKSFVNKQPHIDSGLDIKWTAIEDANVLSLNGGGKFVACHMDLRTSPKKEGENDAEKTSSRNLEDTNSSRNLEDTNSSRNLEDSRLEDSSLSLLDTTALEHKTGPVMNTEQAMLIAPDETLQSSSPVKLLQSSSPVKLLQSRVLQTRLLQIHY